MGMDYRRAKSWNTATVQSKIVDRAAAHASHSEGWPHISKAGRCLCLKACCFGKGGCICTACSCQLVSVPS